VLEVKWKKIESGSQAAKGILDFPFPWPDNSKQMKCTGTASWQ